MIKNMQKFQASCLAMVMLIAGASINALAASQNADVEEELSPGYNECIRKGGSSEDEALCNEKAHLYQSGRLTETYKKARNLCEKLESAAEINKCKEELKKLELSWLDFQQRTYVYLLNEGLFGPYKYKDKDVKEMYADQIPRAKNSAERFAARETKRQADRMDLFYKLWLRWQ